MSTNPRVSYPKKLNSSPGYPTFEQLGPGVPIEKKCLQRSNSLK